MYIPQGLKSQYYLDKSGMCNVRFIWVKLSTSANPYAKPKQHLHFSVQQICSSLLACIVQTHLVQLLKSAVKWKRINSYQSIIIIISKDSFKPCWHIRLQDITQNSYLFQILIKSMILSHNFKQKENYNILPLCVIWASAPLKKKTDLVTSQIFLSFQVGLTSLVVLFLICILYTRFPLQVLSQIRQNNSLCWKQR